MHLSHSPSQEGGGSPLQKAPQASSIRRYSLVSPCLPPSLVVCWALEDQMLRRLFRFVAKLAVGTGHTYYRIGLSAAIGLSLLTSGGQVQ